MSGEMRGVEKRSDKKYKKQENKSDFVKNQRFLRYIYNIFIIL